MQTLTRPKKAKKPAPATVDVATICAELQRLQRKRAVAMKSRIKQTNRLQAIIAGTIGYHAGMKDEERTAKMKEAAVLIKAIRQGKVASEHAGLVAATDVGTKAFTDLEMIFEEEMRQLAGQLPIVPWVNHADRRGFGLLFLAIIIGETGDLANYANPAKVWRRLGCAPWSFNGKTQMGATWKGRYGKQGSLPAEEWENFGYCPRRRSIAYLVGDNIVKQNGAGPYRVRYDEAKAKCQADHPDYKPMRCHLHGMLLATKRLLRDLWVKWNKGGSAKEHL